MYSWFNWARQQGHTTKPSGTHVHGRTEKSCLLKTSTISLWECDLKNILFLIHGMGLQFKYSNKLSYIFWPALSLGFCSVNDDGSSFQKLLFLPSTMCSSPIQKAEWPSLFSLFYSILFCFFSVSLLLFFLPNLKATASHSSLPNEKKTFVFMVIECKCSFNFLFQ